MELSPFTERATCPTCGSDGPVYRSCTSRARLVDCTVQDSDHLHMTCTRCQDTWLMAQKGG